MKNLFFLLAAFAVLAAQAVPHPPVVLDTLADLASYIPARGEVVYVKGKDANSLLFSPEAYTHNYLAATNTADGITKVIVATGTNGLWVNNRKWTINAALAGINESAADNYPAMTNAVWVARQLSHATDMYSNPMGGELVLPGGTFVFTNGPIILPNGFHLRGAGRDFTELRHAGAAGQSQPLFKLQATHAGTNVAGQADYFLSDLKFTSTGQSNVIYVLSTNVSAQITMNNIRFTGGSNGLQALSVEGIRLINFEAANMAGSSIRLDEDPSGLYGNVGIVIENCNAALCYNNIRMRHATAAFKIAGCKANSCNYSYIFDSCSAGQVSGIASEQAYNLALQFTNYNPAINFAGCFFRANNNSGTNPLIRFDSYSRNINFDECQFGNSGTNLTIAVIEDRGVSENIWIRHDEHDSGFSSPGNWANGGRLHFWGSLFGRAKIDIGLTPSSTADFAYSLVGTRRAATLATWAEGPGSGNIAYPMFQSDPSGTIWSMALARQQDFSVTNATGTTIYYNNGSHVNLAGTPVSNPTYILSTNCASGKTGGIPQGAMMVVANTGVDTGNIISIATPTATNICWSGNMHFYSWNATNWTLLGITMPEAPADGILYERQNHRWVSDPIQTDAPGITGPYVRAGLAWSSLANYIKAGANVTVSVDASSNVVIAATGGGGGPTNGSAVYIKGTSASSANLIASSELDPTYSGTNVTYAVVANSIETNKLTANAYSFFLNRANHTGTQLASTISDFGTNVWSKILTSLQRGNGIFFATNAGANTLTISGNYAPGGNVTFTTNADTSITIAASGGGGSSNGTPVNVNGGTVLSAANFRSSSNITVATSSTNVDITVTNSGVTAGAYAPGSFTVGADGRVMAAANSTSAEILSRITTGVALTNSPTGTLTLQLFPSNNITFATNGNGIYISGSAGGGGGGNGTNLFVNNILSQPAKLTNSATVVWTTNANGDIVATASNANATYTTNRWDQPIWISTDSQTSASTNEVSMVGTLMSGQSKQTAANAWTSGTSLRVRASGTFTATGANFAGPTIKVKFGGRILTGVFVDTETTVPSNFAWFMEAAMQVNAAGSSASNTVVGYLAIQYGAPPANSGANIIAMTASGTLDTTVTNYIDFTYQNDGTQPITLTCNHSDAYELGRQTITGGSGQTFADGALIQNINLVSSANITNKITGSTNVTTDLTTTGVTADSYNNFTVDTYGRISAALKPWEGTWIQTEFMDLAGITTAGHSEYPWAGSALGSGTQVSVAAPTNHPGVVIFASATGAASGYSATTRQSTFLTDAGVETSFIFKPLTVDTNSLLRFGFWNNATPASVTDGTYLEVSGGGYVSGRANVGSGTPNITTTSNLLSTNTWYRGYIKIMPDANRAAVFQLYNSDDGSVVWTNYLTSIPARTVVFYHASQGSVISATAVATNLVMMDWQGIRPVNGTRH